MFKKLLAIAATSVCCMGNLPEAQARGWDYCMNAGPTNICAIYETNNDTVQMQGPAGYIRFASSVLTLVAPSSWTYEVFEASTGNSTPSP